MNLSSKARTTNETSFRKGGRSEGVKGAEKRDKGKAFPNCSFLLLFRKQEDKQ